MAEVVYGQLDAKLPPLRARLTGTVRAAVDVVVDAIEVANATGADVQTFADLVRDAVREGVSDGIAAARIEQQAPMFGRVGRFLQANQGLLTLLGIVATVCSIYLQIEQKDGPGDAQPDRPAHVEPLDRAEVERIVEEWLRDLACQSSRRDER